MISLTDSVLVPDTAHGLRLCQDLFLTVARTAEDRLRPNVFKLNSEFSTIYQNSLCKPYEVHAKKSFIVADLLSPPHRFVPDAHAVFVSPHLCPPEPGGTAQDHGVGLFDLLNFDVGALQEVRAHNKLSFTPSLQRASPLH